MAQSFGTGAYDVIVAGAGPVGLTLAIDLGRRGVRCLLMERHPTTLPWPKMDRSNARTMEFYRRIGIVDRVRALGYPPDNPMDVFLTTRLSDPPIAVLKYPSVAERRRQIAESPNGAWLLEPYQLVSQNKLEPLLKEVAEGTPNVTVRYGCELVDFSQDETGVTVHARTVDGGEKTLRCDYLAGCDGATSTIRKKLGIRLEGRGGIRELVQVIFRSDTLYERIVTGRGRHYQFADAAGSSMVAQGDRKEFTLHSSLPPDTDFASVIRGLIGFPCDFEIRYVIPWRHHLLVAERYRDRRVFLAGDFDPSGYSDRWARHEHRGRRRLRPVMEACRRNQRLGRSRPARRLRAGAQANRHTQCRRGGLGRRGRADLARTWSRRRCTKIRPKETRCAGSWRRRSMSTTGACTAWSAWSPRIPTPARR